MLPVFPSLGGLSPGQALGSQSSGSRVEFRGPSTLSRAGEDAGSVALLKTGSRRHCFALASPPRRASRLLRPKVDIFGSMSSISPGRCSSFFFLVDDQEGHAHSRNRFASRICKRACGALGELPVPFPAHQSCCRRAAPAS